jgi:hypothetical protein
MFAIDYRQTRLRNLLAMGGPSIDVKGRIGDPVAPTHLLGLRSRLLFAQDADDSYDRSQRSEDTNARADLGAYYFSLEVGAPVVATVDQTLIRGMGPHDNSSSEGCLALLTGIFAQQSSAEGSF